MAHLRTRLHALVLLAPLAAGACSVNLNAERIVRREDKQFRVTGKPVLNPELGRRGSIICRG